MSDLLNFIASLKERYPETLGVVRDLPTDDFSGAAFNADLTCRQATRIATLAKGQSLIGLARTEGVNALTTIKSAEKGLPKLRRSFKTDGVLSLRNLL